MSRLGAFVKRNGWAIVSLLVASCSNICFFLYAGVASVQITSIARGERRNLEAITISQNLKGVSIALAVLAVILALVSKKSASPWLANLSIAASILTCLSIPIYV